MLFVYVCVSFSIFALLTALILFFFFKQKTAYEMRISDWSSDVCSSDLGGDAGQFRGAEGTLVEGRGSTGALDIQMRHHAVLRPGQLGHMGHRKFSCCVTEREAVFWNRQARLRR